MIKNKNNNVPNKRLLPVAKGLQLRISDRKMKLAADLVRGKLAQKSVEILKLMPKKACALLAKVISSAIANAINQNYDPRTLRIAYVDVGRGTLASRFMPRAKGRSCSITKYSSNISVYLDGEMMQNQFVESLGGEDIRGEEAHG